MQALSRLCCLGEGGVNQLANHSESPLQSPAQKSTQPLTSSQLPPHTAADLTHGRAALSGSFCWYPDLQTRQLVHGLLIASASCSSGLQGPASNPFAPCSLGCNKAADTRSQGSQQTPDQEGEREGDSGLLVLRPDTDLSCTRLPLPIPLNLIPLRWEAGRGRGSSPHYSSSQLSQRGHIEYTEI